MMPVAENDSSDAILSVIHNQFGLICQGIISKDQEVSRPPYTETSFYCSPKRENNSENLIGNPLEIEEIVNLSMESKIFMQDVDRNNPVSRLLNLSGRCPLDRKPTDGFKDGFLYHLADEKRQLFGVFPLTNNCKRVLSICTNADPDCSASIKDLQRQHMPFSSDCQCSYEASYQFSNSVFHAKFDACEPTVLSSPPSFVVGTLMTKLKPYDGESICLNLFKDIRILKVMFDAYENDIRTWSSPGNAPTPEQFQAILPNLFRSVGSGHIDMVNKSSIGEKMDSTLAKRSLDPTELLWDAMKHVASVVHYRGLMKLAVRYLLNNRELIRLSRSNHTRLAHYLRNVTARMGHSQVDPDHMLPLQIESLLEIGLNKVTNDCIALLATVIPDVTSFVGLNQAQSTVEASTCLTTMWATLHHVYKAACLFLCFSTSCSKQSFVNELRTILRETSPKDEWRAALYGGPSDEPFILKHTFSLPVSDLVVPIIGLQPTSWILHLDTGHPMPTSVRLFYELIGTHGAQNYVCHEMKLVETYWIQ